LPCSKIVTFTLNKDFDIAIYKQNSTLNRIMTIASVKLLLWVLFVMIFCCYFLIKRWYINENSSATCCAKRYGNLCAIYDVSPQKLNYIVVNATTFLLRVGLFIRFIALIIFQKHIKRCTENYDIA
jgi:hypothetical protein